MRRVGKECALYDVTLFQPVESQIERIDDRTESSGSFRVDKRFEILCASMRAAAADVSRSGFNTRRSVKYTPKETSTIEASANFNV